MNFIFQQSSERERSTYVSNELTNRNSIPVIVACFIGVTVFVIEMMCVAIKLLEPRIVLYGLRHLDDVQLGIDFLSTDIIDGIG